MLATVSLFLDNRRTKKTKRFPVKLLVVNERIPKMYQTVYDLTQREFDNLSASRVTDELQKIRDSFKIIKREAEQVIEKLIPFDINEFEKEYILNNPLFRQRKYLKKVIVEENPLDIEKFDYSEYNEVFPILLEEFEIGTIGYTYVDYIKSLIRTKQIGTAGSYQSSFKSLREFFGNPTFQKVTPEVLKRYELWMVEKGNKKTTVGIYTRPLRRIFNVANNKRIIRKEQCYPFGLEKYVIPEPKKRKKALFIDDIASIYYHKPDSEIEEKARDFWMFLYLGNGMNTKDMCKLKYGDISENYIYFEREKTKNTNKDNFLIEVYITDDMWNIINKWGNKDKSPDNYIFPILRPGMSALEIHLEKQNFTRFINGGMENVKKKLGIVRKTNSNMARSSFATALKRSGAPREYIKDAMGISLYKTIDHYFDNFEDAVKKEFAERLTAFKKEKISSESNVIAEAYK